MSLTVGELVAYLKVNRDDWKRGLKDGKREYDRFGKDVAGDLAKLGPEIGAALGGTVAKGMSGAVQGAPPQVQGAAVAAAVAIAAVMAPVIGAAITAGVLLAIGGGALAVGIAAAVKDPKVAEAWKGFGDQARGSLARFAEPFKEPLIRAAGTFGEALKRMDPVLARIGATIAPVIDQLAPALAGLAENLLPGIETAVAASVPLFQTLAKHAPEIGKSLGRMFALIAEGAPGAQLFLDHLLTAIEFILPAIGLMIGGFASSYKAMIDGAIAAKNWIVAAFGAVVAFFRGIPGAVTGAVVALWRMFTDGSTRVGRFIVDRLASVVAYVKALPGRIVNAVGDLTRTLYDAGRDLVRGMVSGIKAAGGQVAATIMALARQVWRQIKDFFGIESPSRLMAYAGEMLGAGMVRGIDRSRPGIVAAVGRLARDATLTVPGVQVPAFAGGYGTGPGPQTTLAGGVTVNGPLIGELRAYGDRFSLQQVQDDLAMHGQV